MSVKETIEIIAIERDALLTPRPSLSTSGGNVTSGGVPIPTKPSDNQLSLLWIPYVLIALIFIVFLGANFWCYHKRHRERYLRKRDEKRVKDGLHERRRITALMRSHFQNAFMSRSSLHEVSEDGIIVNVIGSHLSKTASGVSLTDSKLSSEQSIPSPAVGTVSPVCASSAVDTLSLVLLSGSWHTKPCPGRSTSTPESLAPTQLWSAVDLTSNRSECSSSPVNVPQRQVMSADQPYPYLLPKSLFPGVVSPDWGKTPPGNWSPGQLWTYPNKQSLSSVGNLSSYCSNLYPGTINFPPNRLSSAQSWSAFTTRSPVQPLPPTSDLSTSCSQSSDQQACVKSMSADKLCNAQASPPIGQLFPEHLGSADKVSTWQVLSPDKMSPSQAPCHPDKLCAGQFGSADTSTRQSMSSDQLCLCQFSDNQLPTSHTLSPDKLCPSQSSFGETQGPWTSQGGSCWVSMGGGDIKREASNGSLVH